MKRALRPRGVLVTGASGMVGSALVHRLAHGQGLRVAALDRRAPDARLAAATPEVQWLRGDVADPAAIDAALAGLSGCRERIVCHLAAHWGFEEHWSTEYDRSNVEAVRRLRDRCLASGVDHLLFASSLTVHRPPPPGGVLTEESAPDAEQPYGRSKRRGEAIVRETAAELPVTVLRIGAVFTEHCDLPPLYGLLSLWLGPWPLSRMLVGRGETAMPYLHRTDLVDLLQRCIDDPPARSGASTLLACSAHATSHGELFAAVHPGRRALPVPVPLARPALRARLAAAGLLGLERPMERPWMLDYADRPMRVDNRATRALTGWSCRPERDILQRLPRLLAVARADPAAWRRDNRRRNAARYEWQPDADEPASASAAGAARPRDPAPAAPGQ